MDKPKCPICWICAILVIVGAINWGLVGVLSFDLVAAIFGPMTLVSRIIYTLVGISGICMLIGLIGKCKKCEAPKPTA